MEAAATPFSSQVFDGLSLKNKPDLTPFGLNHIRIAYTSQLWTSGKAGDQPDEAAIRKLASSADPNAPLVLDVEHWNVQGDGPDVAANIDKLIQMVNWVHETNPALKVGFFGLLPISNAYLELNYARVLEDPAFPYAAAYVKAYHDLQHYDVGMARLASVVDFVCPALYTHKALGGGDALYQQSWDIAAANAIHEAQQYGKPIYAFLWPQFYDDNGPGADHQFIPADVWRHELEQIRDLGAQGAVIWGSTTFEKGGWNPADEWWAATRDFLGRPDTLVLQVSEDAWKGDAQFIVTVDGRQVGGVQTAHASHAGGHWDAITLAGAFGSGPDHSVAIEFLNDAWGGTPTTDRNLYVQGVSLNGAALAGSPQTLLGNGAVIFGRPDTLVLQVSEDAWLGDAQFRITIDGRQVGDVQTVHAAHANGEWDLITLQGSFGSGPNHTVAVEFLNDAWGGTPDTDRNLYVQAVTLDGTSLSGAPQTLLGNGAAIFGLG